MEGMKPRLSMYIGFIHSLLRSAPQCSLDFREKGEENILCIDGLLMDFTVMINMLKAMPVINQPCFPQILSIRYKLYTFSCTISFLDGWPVLTRGYTPAQNQQCEESRKGVIYHNSFSVALLAKREVLRNYCSGTNQIQTGVAACMHGGKRYKPGPDGRGCMHAWG